MPLRTLNFACYNKNMDLSNSAINKIGNVIRQGNRGIDYHKAVKILNNWRELHGPLVDEYYDKCVKLAENIDRNNIIVAQRLKRLPTIIGKLDRFKNMRLSSMQDIAGVRIIVDDMIQLKLVESRIKKWANLVRIRDYISTPKSSGYRGKHFIFKKNGMLVEIQLRTSLQHLWVTAVETTDIFRGSSLKETNDNTCWHNFFCQVSSIFAIAEKTKPVTIYQNLSMDNLCEMLKSNMDKNKIGSQIVSFALTEPIITNEKNKDAYYLVITLDLKNKEAVTIGYKEKEYHLAFKDYQKQEQHNFGNKQIVLIAVSKIKKIREAYPNYFMDLNTFLNIITFILEKNGEK